MCTHALCHLYARAHGPVDRVFQALETFDENLYGISYVLCLCDRQLKAQRAATRGRGRGLKNKEMVKQAVGRGRGGRSNSSNPQSTPTRGRGRGRRGNRDQKASDQQQFMEVFAPAPPEVFL